MPDSLLLPRPLQLAYSNKLDKIICAHVLSDHLVREKSTFSWVFIEWIVTGSVSSRADMSFCSLGMRITHGRLSLSCASRTFRFVVEASELEINAKSLTLSESHKLEAILLAQMPFRTVRLVLSSAWLSAVPCIYIYIGDAIDLSVIM